MRGFYGDAITRGTGRDTGRGTGMILGWDVGGVNTKAVRIDRGGDAPPPTAARAYEIQRDPSRLSSILRAVRGDLGDGRVEAHAITMTAELSQAFRTKREGVSFVLDAFADAFPATPLEVFAVGGLFVSPDRARSEPLTVAASNWYATAALVGRSVPDALLIDIGTTTTDIIPIAGGVPVAAGRTDPERLASGELVYTGALRTPAEAVARALPFRGGEASIAADGFALIGDAHLHLGRLHADEYSVATVDGRPVTREFAGERLARLICGDRDLLTDAEIDALAAALV
ncbi:MAG: H4MPT-linked C1 transfer pathway protein, partial [Gemmatimonadales bacterium]|nr:H4MPT-linked C1 transfer pathway protein [Gemmatimonadales bacterium]